jgi:hypothetical protein
VAQFRRAVTRRGQKNGRLIFMNITALNLTEKIKLGYKIVSKIDRHQEPAGQEKATNVIRKATVIFDTSRVNETQVESKEEEASGVETQVESRAIPEDSRSQVTGRPWSSGCNWPSP